jgi:hypothetical protein
MQKKAFYEPNRWRIKPYKARIPMASPPSGRPGLESVFQAMMSI